ncbi:MAG: hypothetical protein ACR2H1_04045, partial [Limisphaerales bacterium]
MAKFWKSKTTWKWAGLILLAVGLFVASRFLPFAAWIKGFTEWIQGKGALGVAIFIVSYIVGTIIF